MLPHAIYFPWSRKVNGQAMDLTANKVLAAVAGDVRGDEVSGNDTLWLLVTSIWYQLVPK